MIEYILSKIFFQQNIFNSIVNINEIVRSSLRENLRIDSEFSYLLFNRLTDQLKDAAALPV